MFGVDMSFGFVLVFEFEDFALFAVDEAAGRVLPDELAAVQAGDGADVGPALAGGQFAHPGFDQQCAAFFGAPDGHGVAVVPGFPAGWVDGFQGGHCGALAVKPVRFAQGFVEGLFLHVCPFLFAQFLAQEHAFAHGVDGGVVAAGSGAHLSRLRGLLGGVCHRRVILWAVFVEGEPGAQVVQVVFGLAQGFDLDAGQLHDFMSGGRAVCQDEAAKGFGGDFGLAAQDRPAVGGGVGHCAGKGRGANVVLFGPAAECGFEIGCFGHFESPYVFTFRFEKITDWQLDCCRYIVTRQVVTISNPLVIFGVLIFTR